MHSVCICVFAYACMSARAISAIFCAWEAGIDPQAHICTTQANSELVWVSFARSASWFLCRTWLHPPRRFFNGLPGTASSGARSGGGMIAKCANKMNYHNVSALGLWRLRKRCITKNVSSTTRTPQGTVSLANKAISLSVCPCLVFLLHTQYS